jgi:hypothetical protein
MLTMEIVILPYIQSKPCTYMDHITHSRVSGEPRPVQFAVRLEVIGGISQPNEADGEN